MHLIKALGQRLTPASPTIVQRELARLLKMGFVMRCGLFRGRYRITAQGRAWLDSDSGTSDGEAPPENDPLRDDNQPVLERESQQALFSGGVIAVGVIMLAILLMFGWGPSDLLAAGLVIAVICGTVIAVSRLPQGRRGRVAFWIVVTLLAALVIGAVVMTIGGSLPPTIAVLLIPVFGVAIAALSMAKVHLKRREVLIELGDTAGFGNVDMPREKSPLVAYIFWLVPPLGILAVHRYYLGRYISGILYTCTMSLFMVGWIIDALLIPRLTRSSNRKLWEDWFANALWKATEVSGTARDVKLSTVQAGDYPGAIATKQVLNFRIELIDASGDIERLVPVELVGNAITGSLRDGDQVSVAGKVSDEGILRALIVENTTTSSKLVVRF